MQHLLSMAQPTVVSGSGPVITHCSHSFSLFFTIAAKLYWLLSGNPTISCKHGDLWGPQYGHMIILSPIVSTNRAPNSSHTWPLKSNLEHQAGISSFSLPVWFLDPSISKRGNISSRMYQLTVVMGCEARLLHIGVEVQVVDINVLQLNVCLSIQIFTRRSLKSVHYRVYFYHLKAQYILW